MKIDAYFILIVLSILVVLSYAYNYLASKLKIPSVLLLIGSGIGLKYASEVYQLKIPPTQTLLEILGVTGLIFIVLEAALDLKVEKSKLALIGRAFLSALALLAITSFTTALIFTNYYGADLHQAIVHAIPLSVISSAIAIPSVSAMDQEKKEFVVYESTFSDILGIIAFNYFVIPQVSGLGSIAAFGGDLILIFVISILSSAALVLLLQMTAQVRFFLTFAIIILMYSLAKYLHLPSLILVLCFGMVVANYRFLDFPKVHRFLAFDRLADVSKELKLMTAETAFIIRTFFFLLFGYSLDLSLLQSKEVILTGLAIIAMTVALRFAFLKLVLKVTSTPLALIAPRGLITILLFYSIPPAQRLEQLSEGVLFIVIVLTSLIMTIGLLINKTKGVEKIEEVIH